MPQNYELLQQAMPTRHEKRRIARALGMKNERIVYAWCEDPDGSGKASPLDRLQSILEHALVHQPDAALAILQKLEGLIVRSIAGRADAVPMVELLAHLQPRSEKEATDAVSAFSTALRQVVLSGKYDSEALLREVEEGERALRTAAVMIRAGLEAEGRS